MEPITPANHPGTVSNQGPDQQLDALLDRINGLAVDAGGAESSGTNSPATPTSKSEAKPSNEVEQPFFPYAPKSLAEAGITEASIESLICKYLLAQGEASIRMIADHERARLNAEDDQGT